MKTMSSIQGIDLLRDMLGLLLLLDKFPSLVVTSGSHAFVFKTSQVITFVNVWLARIEIMFKECSGSLTGCDLQPRLISVC